MAQRNTPERRDMLAARAAEQRSRSLAFTPMYRKPSDHIGVWAPAGKRQDIPRRWMTFDQPKKGGMVPAWMDRRTGLPHERRRERPLAQPLEWPFD